MKTPRLISQWAFPEGVGDLWFHRWLELAQLSRDVVITHRPQRRTVARGVLAGVPQPKCLYNAGIVC